MGPKVKKIIAREWLMFLLVLILGPPIGGSLWATYEWVGADRLLFPERPLEEIGRLQIVLKYGELVNEHLYYRLSWKEAESELRKPQRGRSEGDVFIELLLAERKVEKLGLAGSSPLIYKRQSLPVYLYNRVLDPIDWGLYLILTFPVYLAFLFLRSVLWSVRTLRRKEVHSSN